jgi:hypothetical protein
MACTNTMAKARAMHSSRHKRSARNGQSTRFLHPILLCNLRPNFLHSRRYTRTLKCHLNEHSGPTRGPRSVELTNRSTELARDVVEKRDTHQEDEKRDANLLAEDLCPFGQRAAFQPFHQLKDDLPAIQNGNGQQVENPQ